MESELKIIRNRISWLVAIIAALFIGLIFRLWWLQIIEVNKYRVKAQNNRTRHIRDRAQRGRIVDRFNRSLATSRPAFSAYIIPESCDKSDRKEIFRLLAGLLDVNPESLMKRYNSQRTASFVPRKITSELDDGSVIKIETHKYDLPGVLVRADNIRFYPNKNRMCHLLGYVGEISERQLHTDKFADYRVGDIIGQSGMESYFELILNGVNGERWVEVNSIGRINRTLTYPEPMLPVPGHDIVLTVDLDLQNAIEDIFQPWNGAVVVMDPNNGNILAMMSSPGFDPNWFASGISFERWRKLKQNVKHPLINRAIQQPISPGSIFKIITVIAGFNSKTLDESTTHYCNGALKMYNSVFHCWKTNGHGMVNPISAIEESCNVFFYQIGLEAGIDAIFEIADILGLGKKTGVSLPNEKPGLMPSREWKQKTQHETWWPGETISVSIGQGPVETTPIQLAVVMSAIANKGTVYRPDIIKEIRPSLTDNDWMEKKVQNTLKINDRYWDIIHSGLHDVVSGKHGTARKLQMDELIVAGKTGTAQSISRSALKRLGYTELDTPEKYLDHNWFAGFAPYGNPQVVVVVFIEHGGKDGSTDKIQIAKQIFLKWYEINSPSRFGPELPESIHFARNSAND